MLISNTTTPSEDFAGDRFSDRLNKLTVDQIIELAHKYKLLSFDIEYDPHIFYDGVYLDYSPHEFCIHGCSFGVFDGEQVHAIYTTKREDIQRIIDECFTMEINCIAHYSKGDYAGLVHSGYRLPFEFLIRDTATACNLIDEERGTYDFGLKKLTPDYLGYELEDIHSAASEGLDSERFSTYGADDSLSTIRLYMLFIKQIEELGLVNAHDLNCGAILPFADMEMRGVYYSPEHAYQSSERFADLAEEVKAQIYKSIGRVNLASPAKLAQRLFGELKYTAPNLELTKSGKPSTGEKNIAKLAEKYPVCELLGAVRTCENMSTKYLEKFLVEYHYNTDRRIHARFGLLLKTGRSNCINPPLQTCPSKPLGHRLRFNNQLKDYLNEIRIRDGFIPPEGRVLVVADYSSLEYVEASVESPEPLLIEMYKQWDCPKCGAGGSNSEVVRTCPECGYEPAEGEKKIQGKDLHLFNMEIANELIEKWNFKNATDFQLKTRGDAKGLSFLSVFCGTPWKLSKEWNLPLLLCEQILAGVFSRFKGFKKWHEKTEQIIKSGGRDNHGRLMQVGEVRNMHGRRRIVNPKKVKQQVIRQAQEENWDQRELDKRLKSRMKGLLNQCCNFGPQSSGCIRCTVAMRNIRKRLHDEGLSDEIFMTLMVHDEIHLEAPEEKAEYAAQLLRQEMEEAVSSGVPAPVEVNIIRQGQSWSDAK